MRELLMERHEIIKPAETILGYRVTTHAVADCVAEVVDWIDRAPATASCRWLACLNPHSYAMAREDHHFARSLHDADWLIPDGYGVVLASRLLGGQIRERVTGSDIFREVSMDLNRRGGYRVFFLGATEAILADICCCMARDFPAIQVVGAFAPPFKVELSEADHQAMITEINEAETDVLWVGMSAPKQEKYLWRNNEVLNVKFAAAVGAVFDFYTGRVKRSHPAFQRRGLEWLPRLIQQPRRLWRRMGVSAPIFMWQVVLAKAKAGLGRGR